MIFAAVISFFLTYLFPTALSPKFINIDVKKKQIPIKFIRIS
jgi:hypothetical protein